MALDMSASVIAQNYSFLLDHIVVAGWGLLIIAMTVLILPALIMKRKRKTKNTNLLIYHNRQENLQQESPEQWEKAKTHIEKLLYEITEHQPINENPSCRPVELLTETGQYLFEINKRKHADRVSINKNVKPELKRSCPPLDVRELQSVATLAKRLQSRNRHRIIS